MVDKESNLFSIELDTMEFELLAYPKGFMIVGERGMVVDKIDHPQAFGFDGKEKFGSSRGYIWSRAIPLLKTIC